MTKDIYIFSGLGADERVFQNMDFSGYSVTYIKWVIPDKKRSIEIHASRHLNQIKSSRPVLIGLSFGGLMAIEVAKQIDSEKVILIASAKTRQEIPFYYRWAGQLGLHKLLPARLLKKSSFISNWFFGITSPAEKQLLKTILSTTDPVFLNWAIDKTVNWKNQTLLKNLTHIHGTNDRILPVRFVTCDFKIKNGGHFMTVNKADELTKIIRAIIG